MSTLRAATLANQAGTNSPDIIGGELSRARFNLNGTGTIAARDTYNVSSFVDNGVGDYTANFTTAFPAADYTQVGAINANSGSNFSGTVGPQSPTALIAASARLTAVAATTATNTAIVDAAYILVAFFGDKP